MRSKNEVAIVGYACRVPGAKTSDAFWQLLRENRCSVSSITPDRFPTQAFYHPAQDQLGRSYSFAAGVIDDVWGFDAGAFGMSPREAEQVDPQHRHLLEVTYDALAHAGIRPSTLGGGEVGVYVGASSVDHAARFFADPTAADVHMMTGNSLSIMANRLSYSLDLRGPSLALDTACSSSMVALHLAADAIRNNTIDTAIVGGVNLLLSPFSYVGFSRASMLSPTGLCRPFDAAADGYVRAEGAIVVVLRSLSAARKACNKVHAVIVGSGTNQDGRTTGLSLPSPESQRQLLEQVYDKFAIDPADLSFVEAHGTGTRVGDPIEADALGKGLAQRRNHPLLIGSVKSNIGHMEPVSGLAGLLKSIMALDHGLVPATLHQRSPNPDIPLADLNLEVAGRNHSLAGGRTAHLVGVNSFGFGGTNAHTILRTDRTVVGLVQMPASSSPPPLLLSAHTAEALPAVAASFAESWPSDVRHAHAFISAAAHLRDQLPHRLIVQGSSTQETKLLLEDFAKGHRAAGIHTEQAVGTDLPVGFLFSGNGSQWAGMGRDAWRGNSVFRETLREIDRHFALLQEWSIVDLLFADDLGERLRKATYSQPLLFSLQVAIVCALEESGLVPSLVLGHSVGEIAAAWAAGILNLEQAVRIVSARSRHQEIAHGRGSMAALMLSEREAGRFLKSAGTTDIEIAAINSWRSITVAGPSAAIDEVLEKASAAKIGARRLDLDYPFHSALIDAVRVPLLSDLQDLRTQAPRRPFISSVTGGMTEDQELVAEYWWRNVRKPVRFEAALNVALAEGVRVFVEIGPKPVLMSYVRDTMRNAGQRGTAIDTLTEAGGEDRDPIAKCIARVAVAGGQVDRQRVFGRAPATAISLPLYPWQHTQFKVRPTSESETLMLPITHPLLGRRLRVDGHEWYSTVDPKLYPWIADHKVGDTILLPATAYVEIMLAVAQETQGSGDLELRDLDILRPLTFDGHTSFETKVRLTPETGVVELLSRPRNGSADWMHNARAVVGRAPAVTRTEWPEDSPATVVVTKPSVYACARELGFDYGPSFQRVSQVVFPHPKKAVATLERLDEFVSGTHVVDVTAFDAAFHALFATEEAGVADMPMKRMVPVRIGRIRVYEVNANTTRVTARTRRQSPSSILIDIDLWNSDGHIVVSAQDVRLVEAPPGLRADRHSLGYNLVAWRSDEPGATADAAIIHAASPGSQTGDAAEARALDEALLLLEAGSLRAAWEALSKATLRRPSPTVEQMEDAPDAQWPSFLRSALLWHLESKNLINKGASGPVVERDCPLPDIQSITKSLLLRHSDMAIEAAALSRFEDLVTRMTDGDASAGVEISALHWKQLSQSSTQVSKLRDAVKSRMWSCVAACPNERLFRVLMIGADHVTAAIDLCQQFANLEISLTDFDDDRLEQARAALGEDVPQIRCIAWKQLEEFRNGVLDAAFAIDSLSEVAATTRGLDAVTRVLRPGAPVVAGELSPSVFWDIVRATRTPWWSRSPSADFPVGALLTAREWLDELEEAGIGTPTAEAVMGEARIGALLTGFVTKAMEPAAMADGRTLWWIGTAANDLKLLLEGRFGARIVGDPSEANEIVLAASIPEVAEDITSYLSGLLGTIAEQARSLSEKTQRMWVVLEFAHASLCPLQDPNWCAVMSALRVVQNEYAGVEIRCIGLFGASQRLDRAAFEMAAPSEEREVAFVGDERIVFRIQRGISRPSRPLPRRDDEVLRLERRQSSGRGALGWASHPRLDPGPGELEIKVAATGLNFRDVMWNLRLLPEEALEDGYAGAGLGMEAAGTVTRLGDGISGFSVGERVVAFVPQAFASHVIAPAFAVAPLPDTLSFATAATIPVAFLTAYYSLVHLAHLRPGETVLIHGGAGAVGLAALQIAKHLGAITIVTAGSEEKRALLKNLGADLVCNSRSLAFADAVVAFSNGSGVDVVLNSLAGDAMIRSLDCLRPFGRFVELGKRDFYSNTFVGLRPMRRNLSYFGVDVDQLIGHQRELAERLFREVFELFAKGILTPLPHRAFTATHVSEAFHLMQRSAHIGKVVIEPASTLSEVEAEAGTSFPVDADGLHVVIGGTRGFGLATAQWLANRGARHLALVSRSGQLADDDAALVEAIRAKNVSITIAAVDACDLDGLSAFLRQAATERPIKGIVNAAMVLKDQLIQGVERASIEDVLRPKVDAALNLEALAGSLDLDYLLLFSSATTMFGNPGQFNYVAANGFVEGMARRMRSRGLPTLAVAWGAIEDAGFIARNIKSNANLRKRFASTLVPAKVALDGLDWAFGSNGTLKTATCYIARMDWAAAKRELAAVRTPTFTAIDTAVASRQGGSAALTIEKLRTLPTEEAVDAVLDIVVEEIAKVLRLPTKEVDRHRPLAEIGMDSLMMLELRNTVEASLSIDLPMMSLASGITPADVSRRIAGLIAGEDPGPSAPGTIVALSSSHFATDVQSTNPDEHRAAVNAVLERVKQLDGPL